MEKLIKALQEKYDAQNQPIETYLSGLLHAKPINYWDYIQVDTLLSLQRPRTNFPDEMIFVIYHQLTELLLKLIKHELTQITDQEVDQKFFAEKIRRANRYTEICTNSFDVMGGGMEPEQYLKFRDTLTPASGFQSVQFREIEIITSPLHNLLSHRYKEELADSDDIDELMQHMYWQEAGTNRKTGEKSVLLSVFEKKYLAHLTDMAEVYWSKSVYQKALRLKESGEMTDELAKELREHDQLFNVGWPKVHLRTAEVYLEHGQEVKAATGGSEWKRYLHPKYQRRIFFPFLLTKEEFKNWGED